MFIIMCKHYNYSVFNSFKIYLRLQEDISDSGYIDNSLWHQLIVGFGLFVVFVDNKRKISKSPDFNIFNWSSIVIT